MRTRALARDGAKTKEGKEEKREEEEEREDGNQDEKEDEEDMNEDKDDDYDDVVSREKKKRREATEAKMHSSEKRLSNPNPQSMRQSHEAAKRTARWR